MDNRELADGDNEFLHTLWCTMLARQFVPEDESFFALGGNSMLLIRMLVAVSGRFGNEFEFDSFYAEPTLANLGRVLGAVRVQQV